jgi:hypothetical protein
MIKLVEGIAANNKALKGLALKVTFQPGDTVRTEFDLVQDALLDWLQTHGAACGALEIEYEADESSWRQVEQFWVDKSAADPHIQALLKRVGNFDLCMVTPTGDISEGLALSLGQTNRRETGPRNYLAEGNAWPGILFASRRHLPWLPQPDCWAA